MIRWLAGLDAHSKHVSLSSSWLTQWSEELDDEVAVKFFAPGPAIIRVLALAPQGLGLREGGWLVDLPFVAVDNFQHLHLGFLCLYFGFGLEGSRCFHLLVVAPWEKLSYFSHKTT